MERKQWDELLQSQDYVEWAREEVKVLQKEFKEREMVVAAARLLCSSVN